MGSYLLFVSAIVATALFVMTLIRLSNRINVLTAALAFAIQLQDHESRIFLRLFMADSDETLSRRFPQWREHRNHALGIGDDGR